MVYLFIALVAAVTTAACSWYVLRLSRRLRLAPEVRERDVHDTPTPRLGGVAMFIGLLAAFGVAALRPEFADLFAVPARIWAILGAAALIAIVVLGLTVPSVRTQLIGTGVFTALLYALGLIVTRRR